MDRFGKKTNGRTAAPVVVVVGVVGVIEVGEVLAVTGVRLPAVVLQHKQSFFF